MYLLLSPWLQLFLKPQSLPSFIGFVSLVGRERKHETLKKYCVMHSPTVVCDFGVDKTRRIVDCPFVRCLKIQL